MRRPSTALSILLVVGGVAGLVAAFALTLDKLDVLANGPRKLSCDVSVFIGCSRNLSSAIGSLFGFPNPLLGLMMFPAPIVVGLASLGLTRFPRWFWAAFNVGMAFAIGFVVFLMSQSLFNFDIRIICPWCALVWASVIPMAIATTLWNLREQNLPLGDRVARAAGAAYGWIPLITLVCYLVFLVVAQTQLDILGSLF